MEPTPSLFGDDDAKARRALPVLGDAMGEQSDIVYRESRPKSVLNSPAATGIGCWSLNPYVGCAFGCAYCYARYAHRYAMERAGEDDGDAMPPWLAFERRVMVKRDAAAVLRASLASGSARFRPLLSGEEAVVIGTATDPYQPAERRFRVTRAVLEVLAERAGMRVVIITKSALVARDVDVLARLAERSALSVHVSLITLDRALARRVEPRAPTPEARLRAVAALAAAGIDVGINVMPVLPGLTDHPRDLDALVRRAREAGATHVAAGALRLQPAARERYLPWIAAEFPELAERYRRTYARGHYVGDRYRAGLRAFMDRVCARHGMRARVYGRDGGESPESSINERATRYVSPRISTRAQIELGL